MATRVVMPQMGYDMTQGTIARWLKKEGDQVKRGEPLLEVETDKAVVEVEATASGVLRHLLVQAGETVPVGQLVGIIAGPDEDLAGLEKEASSAAPAVAGTPTPARPRVEEAPAPLAGGEGVRASPVARKLAEDKGIELKLVKGTGPGGRITKDDVLAYAEAGAAAPPAPSVAEGERVPLSRMRQAIARNTSLSKREIPHFYVTTEIDMAAALQLRGELNQNSAEGRIGINDLLVKAAAKALAKFPNLNASYVDGAIRRNPKINIGVAVALDEGLIVPALLDCGEKSLSQIAQESRDLVERTRSGGLRPEEYSGATFSISNLGMYDVDSFAAIILPPNAAVMAVGALRKRPVVKGDQVVVSEVIKVTLSVDHRIVDGAEAAQFLREFKRLLERPTHLLS